MVNKKKPDYKAASEAFLRFAYFFHGCNKKMSFEEFKRKSGVSGSKTLSKRAGGMR